MCFCLENCFQLRVSLKELLSTREVGVASLKESFLLVVKIFISLELFSAKELD